jgi:hypothetical protein
MVDSFGAFLTRRQLGAHGKHHKVTLAASLTVSRSLPL